MKCDERKREPSFSNVAAMTIEKGENRISCVIHRLCVYQLVRPTEFEPSCVVSQ